MGASLGLSGKEKADVFKVKTDATRAIAGGSGQQPLIPIDALSDALVNACVENGSLPGLETAIDDYGKLSEQEPSEEELAGAAGQLTSGRNLRIFDTVGDVLYKLQHRYANIELRSSHSLEIC